MYLVHERKEKKIKEKDMSSVASEKSITNIESDMESVKEDIIVNENDASLNSSSSDENENKNDDDDDDNDGSELDENYDEEDDEGTELDTEDEMEFNTVFQEEIDTSDEITSYSLLDAVHKDTEKDETWYKMLSERNSAFKKVYGINIDDEKTPEIIPITSKCLGISNVNIESLSYVAIFFAVCYQVAMILNAFSEQAPVQLVE